MILIIIYCKIIFDKKTYKEMNVLQRIKGNMNLLPKQTQILTEIEEGIEVKKIRKDY